MTSYKTMALNGWIEEPLYSKIKKLIPLPCIDLVVIHKGKVLVMKRSNSPGEGLWFTPGGRIMRGETLLGAAERILDKETGLEASSFEQIGAMIHNWNDSQAVTIFYKVFVTSNIVKMNSEHSNYKWISSLQKDFHPYIKYMIKEAKVFN
jgi:colanic acid biosynthesis protein WcaH